MNWVLIMVVAILAGFAVVGYWKGLLKIAFSLVSGILILVVVIWVSPLISDFLVNHTEIREKIVANCEESIRQSVEEKMQEETKAVTEMTIEEFSEAADKLLEHGIKLPDSLLENILAKISGVTDQTIDLSGAYHEAAEQMADFIIRGVSFLIAFVLATIAAILISGLLGIVSKIPVIGGVNRICGLLVGAVNGLLIVWILFYLVTVFSTSEFGQMVVSNIYENKLLIYLYENNLLLKIILKFL